MRSLLFWAAGGGLGLLALAPPAHAARTIDSVLLSYSTQTNVTSVRVPPSAVIAATVNVTHSGSGSAARWRSTSWRVGGGGFTCVNHANFDQAGTDSLAFNIAAPAVAGTYNADFIAYQDDACSTNPSATFTLTGGVIVDTTAPSVSSINRADPNPSGAASLSWTVTFSESVSGVNATDFALVQGGAVSGASITTVTGGPTVYTVTANTGSGDGSLGLNLVDNDSIVDLAGNRLGGTGAGNGNFTGQVYTLVRASSFNAVQPGANPASGAIFTKISGQNFALDIVALNSSGGLATGFTGTVTVEVVDNAGGGACNSLPLIAGFTNQTFVAGDAGRHPLTSPNTVANVYRNAKVRIKYPVGLPTVISCSSDNFAIRPASLAFAVSDANRTTAGTTRTLNNITLANTDGALTPLHNAGRPFQIQATAYNGAGTPVVTTNYNGTPTAVLTACAGTACTATMGTLTLGTWTASGGTVTTTTASYNDVGAFNLAMQDATFAAVDSGDGTSAAQLTISSTATGVGRFVPDRFVLSAGSTITPRTDIAACSASTFTYMDERMDAVFTLTAIAYPSGTTTRYAGSWAKLVLTTASSFSFGAIDSAAPTSLTSRIITSPSPLGTSGTWASGAATVTAVFSTTRNATPDGPYNSFRLGIAPSDSDGVALDPTVLNLDADNNASNERAQIGVATSVRFGRLRLQNAHGSQLIELPVPVQAQYWNGTAFVTNGADSCTVLGPGNIALGNYRNNLGAGETTAALGGALNAGTGSIRLSAPGALNNGSVDVSLNLTSSVAGASCTLGMPVSTPSGYGYLQGAWCGATYSRDPTARATFGIYRNTDRLIFQRENF